jgi:Arc/MetJ family transcription regulator
LGPRACPGSLAPPRACPKGFAAVAKPTFATATALIQRCLDAEAPDVYKIPISYTNPGENSSAMRTNIEIDDELMAEAMRVTGLPTKKAAVEEALRRLVNRHQRLKALADMAGLGWGGDLDAKREGRNIEPTS